MFIEKEVAYIQAQHLAHIATVSNDQLSRKCTN